MEGLKKIKYFVPITVFAAMLTLYHLCYNGLAGDDVSFVEIGTKSLSFLLENIIERWSTWTSRIFIEFIYFNSYRLPIALWCFFNIAIALLLFKSTVSLLSYGKDKEDTLKISWLVLFAFTIYPAVVMLSAGLIATCANTLWTLAFGVFYLCSAQKSLHGEKIPLWHYLGYIPALLYAANHEQTSALLFGILICFLIYGIIFKKNITYILISLAIVIIGLAVILLCPGNNIRLEQEIANWMPQFTDYSVLNKLRLGFSTAVNNIFYEFNPNAIAFLAVVSFFAYKNSSGVISRISAILPLAVKGIMTFNPLINLVPKSRLDGFPIVGLDKNVLALSAVYLVSLACIIFNIYTIYGKNLKTIQHIILFFAGFFSIAMMGFSPTVYVSGSRTHIYFAFAMSYIMISMIMDNEKSISLQKDISKRHNIISVAVIFALYMLFINIVSFY